VQDRLPGELAIDAVFLEPDQERPFGRSTGQVGRVPAALLQVQVLVLLEPQQGHRLPFPAGGVPAQEDRVFALQFGVLARVGRHHAYRVAEFGPEPGRYPQLPVGDVVEHFVTRHV